MENRNFQLGNEWNIVHYPKKPSGFGILIIGDERHFVDESKCFWLQNEGKFAIIKVLKETGYTVFSSNLYGKNWGSERAVELAQGLYHHVIRSEILNSKIHIIAEGMGALVALKLVEKLQGQIRSIVFLNPILSLKYHLKQEKENKFFYKRLTKEIESAYQKELPQLQKKLQKNKISLPEGVPIKFIHELSNSRMLNQTKYYQNLLKNVGVTYVLPEKKSQLGEMIASFFKNNENVL